MSLAPKFDALTVGEVVVEREMHFTRDRLVRYAGASGDFNPIHYRDDIAQTVGLPGVLAHGMLTMAAAASPVLNWLGNQGSVVDYQSRFTRPVRVDAEVGAVVSVIATVASLDPAAQTARIDLRVVFNEQTVLGKAQLVIAFAPHSA
jgi:acyl dehydratase